MANRKLNNKEAQATFHLLCEPPSRLTCERALELIDEAFVVAGARIPHQILLTNYAAIVEDDGSAPDSKRPLPRSNFGLPGEHYRTTKQAVQAKLDEKYADEAAHKRYPGHQSKHAPDFLTKKTLAIVIGSRGFLAKNVVLYMERYGLVRDELIPMLESISDMEYLKSSKGISHIKCPVYEEAFYPGNFNALLEEMRRMSALQRVAALQEEL